MSNSVIDSIPDPEVFSLRPCPFCGGTAHLHMHDDGSDTAYMIECGEDSCDAYCVVGPYPTSQEARTAWNHRA